MTDRPNLLLITTDQQRFDTIHAAGNNCIYTPHLNLLCDEGVRYSRAYTDCPICIPARITVMTGQYAHTHGTVANTGGHHPLKGMTTLPGVLSDHGYQTRAQGKMHFHPARAHYGFEEMEITADYLRHMRRLGRPSRADGMQGVGANEMEPAISLADESDSLTRWTVDRSMDFLETRDPTRPFFLWTSFFDPHPPFEPGRRFWEIYRDMDLPPAVKGDWSAKWDAISPTLRRPTVHLSGCHRFGPQQWRDSRRAYYATITQIDCAIGLLLGRLRELGLLRNTWIVFSSDHGEMLGDHGLGAKATSLEAAARVPMLIRPPDTKAEFDAMRGSVSHELVCLADIMPTCLALAGIDAIDPFAEPRPFRAIAPLPNDAAVVLSYNLTEPEQSVTAWVSQDDYAQAGGLLQGRGWPPSAEGVLLYDWDAGRATPDERIEKKFDGFEDWLVLLCPIRQGWAVVGLVDKFLSPAGVEVLDDSEGELVLRLGEAKPIRIWRRDGEVSCETARAEPRGEGVWELTPQIRDDGQILRIRSHC